MNIQAENAVSSFFYYMWNAWSQEKSAGLCTGTCPVIFGKNGVCCLTKAYSARLNASMRSCRTHIGGL